MAKDYYEVLGIERNASKDEVKRAFHRLAHKYHPDKKGGDEGRFKEINEAYQILSDDRRRAEYDAYGRTFSGNSGQTGGAGNEGFGFDFNSAGAGFQFDLGDLFGDFFGGGRQARPNRGRDISVDIQLPFIEAVFGCERKILISKVAACETCQGLGVKPGSAMRSCEHCGGKGRLHETKNSFLGSFTVVRDCDRCFGQGKVPEKKCEVCSGFGILKRNEEIKVSAPAGIQDGEMIRLVGQGEAVSRGTPGDLYIKVHVDRHPLFKRSGNDLLTDLNIKLTDALLGAEYQVPALDGELKVKIPEGVSQGELLRVRERGVPVKGRRRGDLLIRLIIKTPSKLSRQAKKLVEQLKAEGV